MSENVRFELNERGLSETLRSSEGIRQALLEAARPALEANNAEANAVSSRYTSRGLIATPYAMEIRELSVPVAVIHSTNKLAARIGRDNGLPHW